MGICVSRGNIAWCERNAILVARQPFYKSFLLFPPLLPLPLPLPADDDDDDFVFEVNTECTIHSYSFTSTQTNASFEISYADTFHIFLHFCFVCRFRKRVICERNTIAVIIVGYSLVLIVCIRAFKISS